MKQKWLKCVYGSGPISQYAKRKFSWILMLIYSDLHLIYSIVWNTILTQQCAPHRSSIDSRSCLKSFWEILSYSVSIATHSFLICEYTAPPHCIDARQRSYRAKVGPTGLCSSNKFPGNMGYLSPDRTKKLEYFCQIWAEDVRALLHNRGFMGNGLFFHPSTPFPQTVTSYRNSGPPYNHRS